MHYITLTTSCNTLCNARKIMCKPCQAQSYLSLLREQMHLEDPWPESSAMIMFASSHMGVVAEGITLTSVTRQRRPEGP
jgi:hypothetical protein